MATKRKTKVVVKKKPVKKTEKKPSERPQNKNLKRDAGPGRPKGQRNYKTIYKEALVRLGTLNKKTPNQIEEEMIAKAVAEGLKGNFAFYKDVMDRIHNKAVQPHAGPSGDGPIEHQVVYIPKR